MFQRSLDKTEVEKEQFIKRINKILLQLQGLIWISLGLFELYRFLQK